MSVELERFRTAVEQLAALREQHHLRVEITPNGAVNLVFDEDGAPHAPAGGGGLYVDVEDILAAIAAGVSADDFARIRLAREDILGGDDEATAQEKYEMVASQLALGLQRRAWLRTTSKVYVLTSSEWEVVSKLADSNSITRPADAAETLYGLLRLDTERGGGGGPPDRKTTVVGLDAEDLDSLIAELSSLRAALGAETATSQRERG